MPPKHTIWRSERFPEITVMPGEFSFETVENRVGDYTQPGPLGLGSTVTKGLWGRDFGVLRCATEALLAGFVRLYWPDQRSGRINW
jgi:hypothetical protein